MSKLKDLRVAARLTQDVPAAALGLSVSQYSRLERKPERLRTSQLVALAALFGCTVNDLGGSSSDILPMASFHRTVSVYSMEGDWSKGDRVKLGTLAPTAEVGAKAYGVEVKDTALDDGTSRAILRGSWVIIDPARQATPGSIVHAIDPATKSSVLRIYVPLHPTNPRGQGYILKATNPAFDDIYVREKDKNVILGVVTELRTILLK